MTYRNYIAIIILLATSFVYSQNKCIKKEIIKKKPKELLLSKADSISKIYERMENYRQKAAKEGASVSFDYNQYIYFDKNCSTTTDLENAYIQIGLMLRDKVIDKKILKISIAGMANPNELKIDSTLSLKRAEFIRSVFILNGIDNSRIELRVFAETYEHKENRNVNFAWLLSNE